MIPIDYETLRVIWWLLLGALLIGFTLFDGYDLGVGALLPFVARQDDERRVLINLVGPTWEGNQVWLILGGGAIFAAWPALYAVSFSGFYLAMIAILLALILRPVAFKFRGKLEDPTWRSVWDWALFIGGAIPALIFGVAVGNVLRGAPFNFDETLRVHYLGSFFGLLTPFPLVCGVVSLAMCAASSPRSSRCCCSPWRVFGSPLGSTATLSPASRTAPALPTRLARPWSLRQARGSATTAGAPGRWSRPYLASWERAWPGSVWTAGLGRPRCSDRVR